MRMDKKYIIFVLINHGWRSYIAAEYVEKHYEELLQMTEDEWITIPRNSK